MEPLQRVSDHSAARKARAGSSNRPAPRRVLVVTASVGAGHDGPARELSDRLRRLGHHVRVVDLVDVAPLGRGLRRTFRAILLQRPRLWGRICESFDETGTLPAGVRALIAAAARRVGQVLADEDIDLVVSTYPLAGRVVDGARRSTGRWVPLVTYVTDPAVHRLWLDEVTDRYLVTWTFAAESVRCLTSTPVDLIAPALAPAFCGSSQIVPAPILPTDKPFALVASGSWGVGDVADTTRDLLAAAPALRPVVVCGRNDRLRELVADIPGAIALGWVRDMPSLMRACSIAVLNSGGLTLAEAVRMGLPVVHHDPLPGQGKLNAAACHQGAGIPISRGAAQLRAALREARPVAHTLGTADPVSTILAVLGEDPLRLAA